MNDGTQKRGHIDSVRLTGSSAGHPVPACPQSQRGGEMRTGAPLMAQSRFTTLHHSPVVDSQPPGQCRTRETLFDVSHRCLHVNTRVRGNKYILWKKGSESGICMGTGTHTKQSVVLWAASFSPHRDHCIWPGSVSDSHLTPLSGLT